MHRTTLALLPARPFTRPLTRFLRPGSAATALLAPALACFAQATPAPPPPATAASAPAAQLERVDITGNYLNAVGTSDAASAGTVTSKLIESRPTLRPAEVLEFVPGVIVSQHSGDGKANQYYLRGFNLDHGTDFATFVDGMPVNMPTHAHGQGYSDLNWLIPELVDRLRYRKGPYAAEDGDFSSAGSARIDLFDGLPRGIASVTFGQDRYSRALVANSNKLGDGQLLYALEYAHNDGPWENPEKFHRANGVLRYSFGGEGQRSTITAMGYSARWHSTDQIPQRAVDAGLIDRFGAIDRATAAAPIATASPSRPSAISPTATSSSTPMRSARGSTSIPISLTSSSTRSTSASRPTRAASTAISSSRPRSARSTGWPRAAPGT